MKGLLFTYLITYCGAAAALLNPFIGILVYICLAIIKPEFLWPWSVPPGNYSRIVALATLVGWVWQGFGEWNLGKARAICFTLVGFLVWSILCAFGAPDQDVAWSFVDQLSKIVIPFVVGVSLIQSVDQLKQIAWVISLSYGYLWLEFNQLYYSGHFIRGEFSFAGMEEGSIAIGMICASGFSFWYGVYQKVLWRKILLFISAALTGHVVLFSFSRGGVLGLLTSSFVAFAVGKKNPRFLFTLTLALLLGLRLAGPEVRERFATIFVTEEKRDASAQSRMDLWRACWQTMLEHPILGIGTDQWTVCGVREFQGKIALYSAHKEAHTLWLQLVEPGFPGLFMIVTFYGLCIARVFPLTRRVVTAESSQDGQAADTDDWTGHAARMVVVPLSGFIVAAQFISLEFLEIPYYIVLFGSGLLKLESTSANTDPLPPPQIPFKGETSHIDSHV